MRSRRSKRVWRRKERGAQAPSSARERGTVLLMVIGVLALLAIMAIVYASLGQSDRRSSSAFVRAIQIEDISGQVGDYVAGVIGKDVHQVVVDSYHGERGGSGPQALRTRSYRPAWTIPSIEINNEVKSRPPAGGMRFSPVGGSVSLSTEPARLGYQPWLASTEPTWVRFHTSQDWIDDERQYMDFHDWLSISNVAPNGQFVNLNNLRNNFGAESGEGNDANGRPRLAENLTLYDQIGDAYPSGAARTPDDRPADVNIPWHWTYAQQNAARPIQSTVMGAGLALPSDDDYLLNQWTDADGDGIADSRWFELNGPAGANADWIVPGLAKQDRARYFAAVRVVDMTGMLNVNTAMDVLAVPGPIGTSGMVEDPNNPALYPFGRTPSDIDFLRALTLQDVYERYEEATSAPYGMANGYALLQQPSDLLVNPTAANYKDYVNTPTDPGAIEIGRAAYRALQEAISADRANGSTGFLNELHPGNNYENPLITPLPGRVSAYASAQADPSNVGYSELGYVNNNASVTTRSPFGVSEALELHGFFGVNDPRQLSRLEAVLEGRRSSSVPAYASYGPLRSTRGLDVERFRRGDALGTNGEQDQDSLAQQHFDLRHRITTVNGARPFTSLPSGVFDASVITGNDLRVDLTPYLYPADGMPLPDAAVKRLFNHVCDALMPYRPGANDNAMFDRDDPLYQDLFYGKSLEFTLRTAAHLVANMIDAADDDNRVNPTTGEVAGPTVFTLQTVRSGGPLPPVSEEFPWPRVTLDKDREELTSDRTDVDSQLVNIYGIEAQPFLVEAGSYAFWTDVPWDATLLTGQTTGGDDEWVEPDPGGPPVELPPITINSDVSATNADFLGEVVAFQVTNPFDREIYLTRAGAGEPKFLYYVEYANRFFPLAELEQSDDISAPPTFRNANVVLKAGETRVFFATSPRKAFAFNERFRVPLSSRLTVPQGTYPDDYQFLRPWIDRQFRVLGQSDHGEPVHTTMFNPGSGEIVEPTMGGERALMDLHGEEDLGTIHPEMDMADNDDRKEIRLWRVLRHSTYDPDGQDNELENDLLADRMRDPGVGEAALFQRLDESAGDEVPDTHAGNDHVNSVFGGGDPQDNTGFSITMWGAIRRPTKPTTQQDASPRGAMPPWCIEARADQQYGWNNDTPSGGLGGRLNFNRDFEGPVDQGTQADYGGADTLYTRIRNLIADQAEGDGGTKINDQMREKPESKKGNPIPLYSYSRNQDDTEYRTFYEQAVRIALAGKDADGKTINAGLFKRAGDILRPLAIGPYYDPHQPNFAGGSPADNESVKRLTLAEAIALAMDYYSPPDTSLYYRAGSYAPGATPDPITPKLDRGQLVLDDFVPYFDVNNDGVFDPAANPKERPIGLGIPLALNLLDKFRFDGFGGPSSAEVGKVSINTSTLLTMSALPMAAPDPTLPWMTNEPSTNNRTSAYQLSAKPSDVAANLMAYRDKLEVRTRPTLEYNTSGPLPVATRNNGTTIELSYRDDPNPYVNHGQHEGRRNRTQIPRLREEIGFRSVGEILAARLRTLPTGVDPAAYLSNSIDRVALDEEALEGHRELEPVTVRERTATDVLEYSDELIDDYGEKLVVANAMLNSITVRSDVFCVWFVIHGYLPADVEGLGPTDPMIPSVARRYMMIVDRSNVVRQGDKPRILLFNEVPL